MRVQVVLAALAALLQAGAAGAGDARDSMFRDWLVGAADLHHTGPSWLHTVVILTGAGEAGDGARMLTTLNTMLNSVFR